MCLTWRKILENYESRPARSSTVLQPDVQSFATNFFTSAPNFAQRKKIFIKVDDNDSHLVIDFVW